MYGQRRVARQPLTLALLATLVVLALNACGGGSAGARHQQQSKPRPLPFLGSYPIAMHPGEYRSTEFKPSFSFRVGKGW